MNNDQPGENYTVSIGTSVTGSAVVSGHSNTVTVTNTNIIQVSADEVKTRKLIETSPYKGLESFEPEDQDRFFGRDQFLTNLVNELEQTNLVLLLGASGSGKSSVVQAGLIPLLAQIWGTGWVNLTLKPDKDPFISLWRSLPNRFSQSEIEFVKNGQDDTLSQLVENLKLLKVGCFIFIDQFEELFTISDPEKRDKFIISLTKLCEKYDENSKLKIIATMRADFLDRLDGEPANLLARITEKHRPLITQMHSDELRMAIKQPAAHYGVVFETGLVEIIIKDVQGQAGYLPLLQYTLDLLWKEEAKRDEFKQERTLQTQTYLKLGGVRGALQKRINDFYASLDASKQIVAQRIFLKLVEIGGDAATETDWKPVRRRAPRSEFNNETQTEVLDQLIKDKLLVSDAPADNSEYNLNSKGATIEIAHEILLSSWETLSNWIKHNREGIALRNRLYNDVRLWLQNKERNDELWNGANLDKVNTLRGDTTFNQVLEGFTPESVKFIEASNQLAKRQMQERIAAGDKRRALMMELLEGCTVQLTIPDLEKCCTGFFVAPGKILTCAPEILEAKNRSLTVKVVWSGENHCNVSETKDIVVHHLNPPGDFAILQVTTEISHPCVYLDSTLQVDDPFCTYGYSSTLVKDGYGRGEFQKQVGKDQTTIEFKTYQDSLKLESSPLLNWRTLKVCGIVQSTHAKQESLPDQDDVTIGRAISAKTILSTIGDLKKEQKAFHKTDKRWSTLFPPRCKPRTIAFTSLAMTVLVLLIRSFQVFQPLELFFYDFLIRSRINPPKPSDRFLIVQVTKEDFERQREDQEVMTGSSLSDVTLVRLLETIQTLEPIAIGLDLYRDQSLNVDPALADRLGSLDDKALSPLLQDAEAKLKLANELFKLDNFFAVCKTPDQEDVNGIAPPPSLVNSDRVGFSDFSVDQDGVLRRQVIAYREPVPDSTRCLTSKSFGLVIAEHFLQANAEKSASAEAIQTNPMTAADCSIEFSNGVVLPNLYGNTGGYQGFTEKDLSLFEGCQALLNYREQKPDQDYKIVTLEEFLKPDFPVEGNRNRIVLVGVDRTDGVGDNWATPYNRGLNTTGVVIQAQMIDQIIDVALKKANLIWVLSGKVDTLLILLFALVGGGSGWLVRSPQQLGLIIALSGSGVLILSFAMFQVGGWVPLMPHFLAFSGTSMFIFWCNHRLGKKSNIV